jgi:hypothetical protein
VFIVKIANPYKDSTLKNLNLDLRGFTEDYIKYYPLDIPLLEVGESEDVTVEITAPGYFTKGEYVLTFYINGELINNKSSVIPFKYKKEIILYIFEVSRSNATSYKELAVSHLQEMRDLGLNTKNIEELLDELLVAYNETEFKQVKDLYEEIYELYTSAKEASEGIEELSNNLKEAEEKEIEVEETKRILHLAESSFNRGKYKESAERVKEAKLTFAIEAGGKFIKETLYSMKKNPEVTGMSSFGFLGFIFVASLLTKYSFLKRKLKKLAEEEELLTELMKEVQVEVFQRAKMSMKEYGDSMIQYEKRLHEVVQERIMYETKKRNLFKMKSKNTKLKEERDRILEMIKVAQKDYISGAKYETRIYENMLKSYSNRLAEIEEKLAVVEIKAMKNKIK